MEQVIGEYGAFGSAQDAVRGLERGGISIQNVLIVDRDHQVGRKLRAGRSNGHARQRFVVVMRGEAAALASATELLSQLRAKGVPTA